MDELIIRPWRDDEEDEFVAFAADPRVTALIGDGSPWSSERARARFRRAREAASSGRGMWWRAGDESGGLVGLLVGEFDDQGAVEIGYWIVPEEWGRGRARELVTRAVRDLGTRFPAVDLVAETHVDNQASAVVLLRCGFVEQESGVGRYDVPVRRFRRRS